MIRALDFTRLRVDQGTPAAYYAIINDVFASLTALLSRISLQQWTTRTADGIGEADVNGTLYV